MGARHVPRPALRNLAVSAALAARHLRNAREFVLSRIIEIPEVGLALHARGSTSFLFWSRPPRGEVWS
jgi:hypothetical protein